MSGSRYRTLIYIGLSLVASVLSFACKAQSEAVTDSTKRGPYSLVTYVGGGLMRFVGTAGTPPGYQKSIHKTGGAATFRVMWHPDHRLKFGIESGWTQFYSYDVQGGLNVAKVNLTGVPLLLVFSMPITKHISVFAGTGGYMLTSNLEYQGTVNATTFAIGYMASAMYTVPLSQRLSLAGEFKWMNARETKDGSLSLQLLVLYKVFEW